MIRWSRLASRTPMTRTAGPSTCAWRVRSPSTTRLDHSSGQNHRKEQSLLKASSSSTRPLWRQLEPGAYGCGFRSVWQFDYGRTYNTVFDDKTQYAEGKSP